MIHFGKENCDLEGIELHLYRMEKLIITNYQEKHSFVSITLTSQQLTKIIKGNKFWVIFDNGKARFKLLKKFNLKGLLRVGVGQELSLENQIVTFRSEKHKSLGYFSFNKMFTSHVWITNLESLTLTAPLRQTLELMDEIPQLEGIFSEQ